MTDPTRMNRSDETPDELRALLAHAASPKPLSPEDRAKILAGAVAIAAGTAVTTTAAAAVTAGAVRSTITGAGFFVKVVGLAAVVVSVGLGARTLVPRTNRPAATAATAATAPSIAQRRVEPRAVPTPTSAAITAPPAELRAPLPQPQTRSEIPVLREPSRRVEAPSRAPSPALVARVEPSPSIAIAPASTASACPVERGSGGLAHESRVLAAATAALASDPAVAAECVRSLDVAGTSDALRDELLFVGFDAARRLGRSADARRYAESLVARSPSSSYASRAQRWLEEH